MSKSSVIHCKKKHMEPDVYLDSKYFSFIIVFASSISSNHCTSTTLAWCTAVLCLQWIGLKFRKLFDPVRQIKQTCPWLLLLERQLICVYSNDIFKMFSERNLNSTIKLAFLISHSRCGHINLHGETYILEHWSSIAPHAVCDNKWLIQQ